MLSHRMNHGFYNNDFLIGWNNVDIFGVPVAVRGNVFVKGSSWWVSGLETTYLLNVPLPPYSSNYKVAC